MKYFKLISISLLFLASCGELNYSPYEVEVDNLYLNSVNLEKIYSIERESEPASSENTTFNNYSIAVLSDTHTYYDGLERQIAYINEHSDKYDFVIITGDMTNVGMSSEFNATIERLEELEIPFITTSGNHDLLIDGEAIYARLFGEDTYILNYKNTNYIIYNNNNWESSKNVPDLNWLEAQLVKAQAPHRIVLSHVAPNDQDRFSPEQIELTKDLINNYQVDLYINGHNHNPAQSDFGEATHLTVGASSKNVFLELNFKNDELTYEFINL
tara:strand:- start:136618 stop:137430 length:813 start_codon:yes stop_codon:yes gene_type:complete